MARIHYGCEPAVLTGNGRAILWAILATGLFALVAALAKLAVVDYHVLQILFVRQIVVFLSTLPVLVKDFPDSLKTRHPGLHAWRLAGAFVALGSGIWAVAVLPLTTAITLGFAQVFFVAVLAALLLRENVGRYRAGAILAGFAGVVITMRPGVGGFFDLNALIPLAGALGAAVAITSVRRLSKTESTATLLVWQSLFVGILAGLPMFWFWKTPDLPGLLLLLSMALLATAGQWAGVWALRLGEASVVGNIEYTKLVWAALLGLLLFGEVPDMFVLTGGAIIVSSSVFLLHRERVNRDR